MKFKFDPNQEFQLDAVNSIVNLFEGQGKIDGHNLTGHSLMGIYSNQLTIDNESIIANAKRIYEENKIGNGGITEDLDFSIEMETGTGKTYVYLRTIFELNKKYGWKKYIILVPSVAIREGVVKTLELTKTHFGELYSNTPYRFYEYQSKNISQVKHFADSNSIEIMIMTVGAFNKDSNVLYGERDQMQGEQPIKFIQQTQPILILDEPQNMEGNATKEKLKEFNSLFRLRYSATHKNPYNLMYQLTSYDAYRLGLVKKIEVYSVTDDDSGISNAFINLVDVKSSKTEIKATIEVFAKDDDGNVKRKKIVVKTNDDVSFKANNSAYEGYLVERMSVDNPDFGAVGSISFKNGISIKLGENTGKEKEEIMREQIRQTIRIHFEKKKKLEPLQIKVLSLFFIDKVDNYVKEDGIIRQYFIEEFEKLKKEFGYDSLDVNQAHDGYFAKKNDEYLERERSIQDNEQAYELIMKAKERLLSFSEPTEFIFSHSALREGWDNPNVFNICTLNATSSTMKKRQEIGRGMRICVNQDGERVFSKQVNLLSVIANESYSDYVQTLQGEFVEDGIYKSAPAPENAKRKYTVKLKKDFEKDEDFKELWEKISKKTRYIVSVETDELIKKCIARIDKEINIQKPRLKIDRVGIDISEKEVTGQIIGDDSREFSENKRNFNIVEIIKNETELTRATVSSIILGLSSLKSFFNNPEKFTFEVIKIIKNELNTSYIEQISYEIIPENYDLKHFTNEQSYKDSIQPVNHSIYDSIIYDSDVEKKFAIDLDSDERMKLFIKLPNWFKVPTPIGDYNPDWAIVTTKKDLDGVEKEKLYFVIETKGNISNLRPTEKMKIDSAKRHFDSISVNYKEISSYSQFVQAISN
jgi:type III restriction enzyme